MTKQEDRTFIGNDGLLHCADCGGALQRRLPMPILGKDIIPATCKCREESYEKRKREALQREHENKVKSYRSICFHEKKMRQWTFENDNGSTSAMKYARRYVEEWNKVKEEGIGLLLWGGVGTGKTYMAACIANALIEQEQRVLMTDFAAISNISVFDSEEYMNSLSSYDLLIIDDYGAERNSQFALQNVFDVINRWSESGKPLIITTNHELNTIRNYDSEDMIRARINDRILEMCKPIHVDGTSKRIETGINKMNMLRGILEGGEANAG